MEVTMTKPITNTAIAASLPQHHCSRRTSPSSNNSPSSQNFCVAFSDRFSPNSIASTPPTHYRPKTFMSHFRTDSRQILSHPLRRLIIVPKLLCRIFGQILAKFYRIQPGHAQATPFRASDTITSSLNFPTTYPYKPSTDLNSAPLHTQRTTPIQQ